MAPVLIFVAVLVGGLPVSVLLSSSGALAPSRTAVTFGPSSSKVIFADTSSGVDRLALSPSPSVIVTVSASEFAASDTLSSGVLRSEERRGGKDCWTGTAPVDQMIEIANACSA